MSARRLLALAARGIASLVVLLAGAWGALALHYHPPVPALGQAPAILFGALALAAALGATFVRRFRPALAAFAIMFLGVLGWWSTIAPNGRLWAPELAETPYADTDGDRVVVHNIRNFDWRSETDFSPAWESRAYDLSKLVSTDLIAVYWAGPSIAHTIVSFGFEDGRHLAFSIEVRHAPAEDYSAIPGLFKNFELIFVAADERDVLGLRRVRNEEPYLFNVRVDPARARLLFREYLRRAGQLREQPAFYDTLTVNCTTVIFAMLRAAGFDPPWNWRILVSGYVPDLLYTEHLLDERQTIEQLRTAGRIGDKSRAGLDSTSFSAAIREGVPLAR